MQNGEVKKELKMLEKRGLLKPEDVVEFAKNPKTALHEVFVWDDTEAAHFWRLHQARNLIRVVVTVNENTGKEERIYVSLRSDRSEDGGGYRQLVRVLNDKEQREELLKDAYEEWQYYKAKYQELKELASGIEKMDLEFSKVKSKKRPAELTASA